MILMKTIKTFAAFAPFENQIDLQNKTYMTFARPVSEWQVL